ncbi:hypothetical protein ACFOYU_13120 [Microvirga sp. GCM10011540]|uniref:hypothetical protein n=1 Tax=Microvirga sp. GCM10011540 TaxID=3317338 RepID=UPI00360CDBFE
MIVIETHGRRSTRWAERTERCGSFDPNRSGGGDITISSSVHPPLCLRKNGATAYLLAFDNAKAAVAVHRRIGDRWFALLSRSNSLGLRWKGRGEEKGNARQSKSVRTLHEFTYLGLVMMERAAEQRLVRLNYATIGKWFLL